jgi:hypothetical protein
MRRHSGLAEIPTFAPDFIVSLLDLDFYYELNNKNKRNPERKVKT